MRRHDCPTLAELPPGGCNNPECDLCAVPLCEHCGFRHEPEAGQPTPEPERGGGMRIEDVPPGFVIESLFMAQVLERAVEIRGTYGDDWRRRGGTGAYMHLTRHFDRLETCARRHDWDAFEAGTDQLTRDSVRRSLFGIARYAMLIAAELSRRDARDEPEPEPAPGPPPPPPI